MMLVFGERYVYWSFLVSITERARALESHLVLFRRYNISNMTILTHPQVMTVPKSRFMHAANQNIESGIATLPELNLTPSNDEGYWGVYRHRLSMVPDSHTDPTDAFTSPYVTSAKSNPAAPVINIPPSRTGKIVPGRVKLDHIRDNIVFVREGQRQPNLEQEELDTWRESIAPHVESWIKHLDTERNKNGVLAFTTHISHEQPPMIDTKRRDSAVELDLAADLEKLDVNSDSDAKAVPETNQLAYFLDLAHFELAGRSFKGHVQLRRNTIELYGPGGKHEGEKGKVVLFVELCVLKKGDLDAEYVGCMEGTGLMYLRDLDV